MLFIIQKQVGNTVVVRAENYDYLFMHLYKVDVIQNQEVVLGQRIGGVGTTGTFSTGNHLHFSITEGSYLNRKYINPLIVLGTVA